MLSLRSSSWALSLQAYKVHAAPCSALTLTIQLAFVCCTPATFAALPALLQRKCSKLQAWAAKALQQALPDLSLAELHKQLLRQAASSSSSGADRLSLVGVQRGLGTSCIRAAVADCIAVQPSSTNSSGRHHARMRSEAHAHT
jgi:hypothetical protein